MKIVLFSLIQFCGKPRVIWLVKPRLNAPRNFASGVARSAQRTYNVLCLCLGAKNELSPSFLLVRIVEERNLTYDGPAPRPRRPVQS